MTNPMTPAVKGALLWLVILLALIALAGSRLSGGQITVQSDLLSLVGQNSLFDHKIKQIAQRQQKKLIIVVASAVQATVQQHSAQLSENLAALEHINHVTQLPFNPQQVAQITALYADYPFTLLNDDYRQSLEHNSPDTLTEAFMTTLLQPGNPFIDLTIDQDPTLALANGLQQQLASQSQWLNDGNALYQTLDGVYYYPLFIELSQAGFGVNQSVVIAQNINDQLNNPNQSQSEGKSDIHYYRSGLLFHVSDATTVATNEIQLFSLLSAFIILAATFWVFRSLKPLLAVLLVISVCITFGTAGLVSMVNEVHLLTFVFAVSLIGISVDYAFHALAAAALVENSPDQKQSLARYLAPAMIMGAVTTIIGY
ncbi:MAG: putative exporter, partial [Phenylobacterium sp.]